MKMYVAFWLCVALAACVQDSYCGSVVSNDAEMLVSEGNEFALDVYNELVEITEGGNIFFSPVSISLALAMTYAGARGETKSQMATVLGFEDDFQSDYELYVAFQELIGHYNNPAKNYTMSIANRLFGHKDYDFLQEFLDITANHFNASLEKLDFAGAPESSRRRINSWVEEKTNNKIQELLAQGTINSDVALVLINAIYFKALWSVPFDVQDTETLPFYTARDSINVYMMSAYDYFPYLEDSVLNAKILQLPYGTGEVSMFVVLPNERTGLEQMENDLAEQDLDRIFAGLSNQKVDIRLPRFKLTQDVALKALLGEMGMMDLFDGNKADLSGMDGSGRLYVTEVLHKAFIDVNEEGTEAAAATGVIVSVTSVQEKIEFHADHPFMFFIVERDTQSILFMGRLTDPLEEGSPIGEFGKSSMLLNTGSQHTHSTIVFTVITIMLALFLSGSQ